MLLDPVFPAAYDVDPGVKAILALISGDSRLQAPIQHAKGIYEIGHWNGEHEVDQHWWLGGQRDYDASYPVLGNVTLLEFPDGPKRFGSFGPYGVCDSYEQLLERCPELVNDESRGFFVFMCKIRKDEQPPQGGWRWHKWGEYIGTQNPQHEYIYDEPHIEEVYTYHVYEVINKESLVAAGVKVAA